MHLFTFPNLLFAGDAGDGGGAAGSETGSGAGSGAGSETGGSSTSGDGGSAGDGDGGEEWTPPTREEHERLVAANAKAQADAQNGEYETLYKGEQERAAKLVSAVTGGAVRSEAIAIAGRLGMTNPALAPRLIDLDGIEAAFDEDAGTASVAGDAQAELERRIAKVLEDTPGLLGTGGAARRQVPGAGNSNA